MADFAIYAGDTDILDVTVTNADGTAFDLTGWDLTFTAVGGEDVRITKEAEIAVDPTTGEATIEFEPDDTANFPEGDTVLQWVMRVATEDDPPAVHTLGHGSMTVTQLAAMLPAST